MPTILHITTVADSFVFMRGQLGYMKAQGFDIIGVTSPGPRVEMVRKREGIEIYPVEMPRRITPLEDLRALWELVAVIQEIKPDIVHGHTPKGGLLAMIAATIARVPHRVYHMRGLPMETARGSKRALLATTERISCGLAREVITVGRTMRETAIAEGLCPPEKIRYLGAGSSNGVDARERFNPERVGRGGRGEVRLRYGIPNDAVVLGFVGRLVVDKGIVEFLKAFEALEEQYPALHLLLLGPFEERDALSSDVRARLEKHPRIHLPGFVEDTATYYSAMDLFCLPTHREGFPNSPLEAAAMGLPVVVSDIGPCREVIVEGETGLLFPVGNAQRLKEVLEIYLKDEALRQSHGEAGRARVLARFQPEQIWEGIAEVYAKLLTEVGSQRSEVG